MQDYWNLDLSETAFREMGPRPHLGLKKRPAG